MTWFDLLFAAILTLVLPIQGVRMYRRFLASIRSGDPRAKLRTYRNAIIMQWLLVALLLGSWLLLDRPLAALGFSLSSGRGTWIGLAAVAVVFAFLWLQRRAVDGLEPADVARLRSTIGMILPGTRGEVRVFRGLSLTAGTCEELFYRGFMHWLIGHGLGPWLTVLAASVPFGVAHAYQGWIGIAKTLAVGLLLGALYQATGSIVWPMIVHSLIDLSAGAIGRQLALRAAADEAGGSPLSPAPTGSGATGG